jgi:hypothetical protein
MAVPWLGAVTPFTLNCPAQFRAAPPPALTSDRYARNYNEVKALGAFSNSARTPEQTELAYFFADNFLLLWNRALQAIAGTHVNNIGDSARLFALASLATADAVITAWESKKHYVFWRPLTAIQEGDNDGNSQTVGDPAWQPLLNTPNYAAQDAVDVRIYQGIHFRFADTAALKQGRHVAKWTFNHFLRPVDDVDDDEDHEDED